MSEDRSPRQMMGNQLRQDNAADDPEKKWEAATGLQA
jgi:hypothetical protein